MVFDANKPIYLQIVDDICDKILAGAIEPDTRIPSVREYGAQMGVNPNTIVRSYEKLTTDGIIYNKRGIGYFVCSDAKDKVLSIMRDEFIHEQWPQVLRKAQLLGLDLSELLSK